MKLFWSTSEGIVDDQRTVETKMERPGVELAGMGERTGMMMAMLVAFAECYNVVRGSSPANR